MPRAAGLHGRRIGPCAGDLRVHLSVETARAGRRVGGAAGREPGDHAADRWTLLIGQSCRTPSAVSHGLRCCRICRAGVRRPMSPVRRLGKGVTAVGAGTPPPPPPPPHLRRAQGRCCWSRWNCCAGRMTGVGGLLVHEHVEQPAADEPGDAVCWLHELCPSCGAMPTAEQPHSVLAVRASRRRRTNTSQGAAEPAPTNGPWCRSAELRCRNAGLTCRNAGLQGAGRRTQVHGRATAGTQDWGAGTQDWGARDA